MTLQNLTMILRCCWKTCPSLTTIWRCCWKTCPNLTTIWRCCWMIYCLYEDLRTTKNSFYCYLSPLCWNWKTFFLGTAARRLLVTTRCRRRQSNFLATAGRLPFGRLRDLVTAARVYLTRTGFTKFRLNRRFSRIIISTRDKH